MKKHLLALAIFILTTLMARGQTVDFEYSDACYGDTTTLINTSVSADSIVSAKWDLNGDGNFNNAYGDTIKHVFGAPGFHNVGLKIITISGISKATYRQISVGNFPVADFTYKNTCFGQNTEFTNLSTVEEGELEDFIWDFGDQSGQSYLKNPSHYFSTIDIYNVSLTVISEQGCRDSITQFVSITNKPNLILEFSGDTVFYEGDSLVVAVVGVFDSILWSTGQYGNFIVIKQSGVYEVTVYSQGCSNSQIIPVTVKELPGSGVMNVITPNGDGFNDRWQIFLLEKVGPCSATVFNRWGMEVYTSTSYDNKWEGTINGEPLQEGTYYYVVKCTNGKVYKGPINIIR